MNQRAFRTLLLWFIWASTSLTVYLSLYRDTAVWEFIGRDPSHVTWLILALFVFGVVGSFALTMLVTFEWIRGIQAETAAAKGGLEAIVVDKRRRVVDRFFHALQETLRVDGEPNVEALLNVELAIFKRISHTIEVIGNILITLGLIGTVMGLTLTLTGLTSSLDALGHDQELLLSGLRRAMGGMGTAFYTTLLGAVLGGVLLRVFSQITDLGVDSLFDLLLRVCLVYCSQDYKPSMQRDLRQINRELDHLHANAKGLREALDQSKSSMEYFHQEISKFHREQTSSDESSIVAAMERHRRYCEMLREEVRLLETLKSSWWARFKSLFRF